jgi:Protein of unknown function (DUF2652)
MSTRRAVLMIADIGGYTDYMQFHRSVLGHAEAATSRMLGKVVAAARGFDLIEIEGDAAFLSRDAEGLESRATLDAVTSAAFAMHGAFHAERQLVQLNMCPCGSCKQTDELKLKFVAHVGEVATQSIKRRKKLVGVDVIHVHRMLKNPVEVPEYLLVTDELFASGGAASPEPAMQGVDLDLDGIGQVRAHYVDVGDLAAPPPRPSWGQRIGGTFAMVGRGLPYAVGRKRAPAPAPAP